MSYNAIHMSSNSIHMSSNTIHKSSNTIHRSSDNRNGRNGVRRENIGVKIPVTKSSHHFLTTAKPVEMVTV
ncbi:hypothetical protein CHS0354_005414 [Potamilus streckersoni]|uniref:Uncharacterized protein n=1 Tax=Potamilus streckersoni TaxID=2493646 RepID=A0AAE0T6C7_9BIVA|nr:hypothetical protein CHS0354_005414 [Potamilus streckersoni]